MLVRRWALGMMRAAESVTKERRVAPESVHGRLRNRNTALIGGIAAKGGTTRTSHPTLRATHAWSGSACRNHVAAG